MAERWEVGEVLHLPFVFVPQGLVAPAWWRAAHPDAVSLPARLIVRRGVQRVQFAVPMPAPPPFPGMLGGRGDPARDLAKWLQERFGHILRSERFDDPADKRYVKGQRPVDAPGGTVPVDQPGLNRDEIHRLKKQLRARAKDWVGIAPNGDVILPDETGKAENHGPFDSYIDRQGGRGR